MDDRICMVAGEDDLGDHHLFMSDDPYRSVAAYERMTARYRFVIGNEAMIKLVRPDTAN